AGQLVGGEVLFHLVPVDPGVGHADVAADALAKRRDKGLLEPRFAGGGEALDHLERERRLRPRRWGAAGEWAAAGRQPGQRAAAHDGPGRPKYLPPPYARHTRGHAPAPFPPPPVGVAILLPSASCGRFWPRSTTRSGRTPRKERSDAAWGGAQGGQLTWPGGGALAGAHGGAHVAPRCGRATYFRAIAVLAAWTC